MKKDWEKVYQELQESWGFKGFNEEEEPSQEFSSEKTSRKQVAQIHTFMVNKGLIKPDVLMLDWGGGKYDVSKDFIQSNVEGVTFLTYDPFNRSSSHNAEVLSEVEANGGADIITLANVLNVIKEKEIREQTIQKIYKQLKKGGTFYISVYKAPKSNEYVEDGDVVGQMTKDGWQNAQPIGYYLPEVKKYFPNAYVKNNIIIAEK